MCLNLVKNETAMYLHITNGTAYIRYDLRLITNSLHVWHNERCSKNITLSTFLRSPWRRCYQGPLFSSIRKPPKNQDKLPRFAVKIYAWHLSIDKVYLILIKDYEIFLNFLYPCIFHLDVGKFCFRIGFDKDKCLPVRLAWVSRIYLNL